MEDIKLIVEMCKKNGIKIQDNLAEGEFNVVATENSMKRVPKDYELKEGEFFVTEKTAGVLLAKQPKASHIVLNYTPQEIQETINKCHYELTEQDIKSIN